MVIMRIHCGACGGTWEVYRKQRDVSASRACPHCDYTIDRETWAKKILPAFQAVGAANMALASDHTEKHTAEFEIDYISDGQFQNASKGEILNEIEGLKEDMQTVAQVLQGMGALAILNSKV